MSSTSVHHTVNNIVGNTTVNNNTNVKNTDVNTAQTKSSFAEIMSQQLAEEMMTEDNAQQYAFENPDDFAPDVFIPYEADWAQVEGEEVDLDELLARELQQMCDHEYASSISSSKITLGSGKVTCGVYSQNSNHIIPQLNTAEVEHKDTWKDYVKIGVNGDPVSFSNIDDNGEIITKHNQVLCGLKNANYVERMVTKSGNMEGVVLSNEAIGVLKAKKSNRG
jgi:hypothetical protein